MCGRFALNVSAEDLSQLFHVEGPPSLPRRYNVAPTQEVVALRRLPEAAGPEYALLRWGLVPSWAKDPSIGARMINARSETVAEKPSFRTAMKRRRCLVAASGFYEWQKTDGQKQPWLIHRRDGRPFAMAGLWESWSDPAGSAIESVAILTTSPNGVMEPLHDRMPVILAEADFERWLDPATMTADPVLPLLRPCPDDWLARHRVSRRVNNPRNDDAACIEPVPDA